MSGLRAGTYSIVARDPATGELGVAVQSHWFSVGSIVTWARPGVGAVATQSVAEPAYGPRLLARLATGEDPTAALAAELAADDSARFRQVAAIDAAGRLAAHTGEGCMGFAGHSTGPEFSAQANMMASEAVWPAMATAFEAATGPLERRLLAALEAAEEAGGDVRGKQSAALLVVPSEGDAWRAKVELRVEDAPEPLAELGRLLDLHDAYEIADRADSLAGQGRHDEAAELYGRAAEAAPPERRARLLGRARNRRIGRSRRGRSAGPGGHRGRGWLASPALAVGAGDCAVGGGRPRGARGPEGSLVRGGPDARCARPAAWHDFSLGVRRRAGVVPGPGGAPPSASARATGRRRRTRRRRCR